MTTTLLHLVLGVQIATVAEVHVKRGGVSTQR